MEELQKKIKYDFQNLDLLKMALTHRSKGSDHNERLEFLGDAMVNFVVADILYHNYPQSAEGELSRLRAVLVNRDALAVLARDFDLGEYLLLGPGEMRSGGKERHSILSCGMEALIGAVYLDAGFDIAKVCVTAWYEKMLHSLTDAKSHKDPKTLLQEYLQRHHLSLPIYQVVNIEGQAHQQHFTVRCHVDGVTGETFGKGPSRRRAEQEAAQAMLDLLKN